jgi:hypothetical protein
MPRFVVRVGAEGEETVEAEYWQERGTFIVFHAEFGEQLYALPKRTVRSIKKVLDADG